MSNFQKVNEAILFRKPSIVIAKTSEYTLTVEIDLFNDHIEWIIVNSEDIDIFSGYDSAKAIEEFSRLASDEDVEICL